MVCRRPPFEIAMCGKIHYDYFLKNGLNTYVNVLGFGDLFSNDILCLLNMMIEPNPKKRITIKKLMCHSYLKNEFEKRGLVNYKW
jgi:serine/threonine protein kinase